MQAPDFWWRPKPNWMARLLSPIGSLYGAVTTQRMGLRGKRSSLPVLCIGNFVAGGAGKTPTALAIARHLQAQGERPVFLSRGYRGKAPTPCLVDMTRHSAHDVGDEALLLARVAPTIIGADRAASAKLAKEMGASLIILDDGLQNPSLSQDWRLAVVDSAAGIGNGLCIPAGPLRAPLKDQLAHVSAALFIGEGDSVSNLIETVSGFGKPILTAKLVPEQEMSRLLTGRKILAFAGIGLPQKFKKTLEALGAELVGWRSFPDHHAYSLKTVQELQVEAQRREAHLVTTEKDFVRIAPFFSQLDRHLPQPMPLPVDLVFDDEEKLNELLALAIKAARAETI